MSDVLEVLVGLGVLNGLQVRRDTQAGVGLDELGGGLARGGGALL